MPLEKKGVSADMRLHKSVVWQIYEGFCEQPQVIKQKKLVK